MKTILVVLSILFAFSLSGFSQQNILMLKKKTNGREKILKEGKRIRVHTKNGNVYRGHLDLLSDTSLLLKQDTILISRIEKIRTKSLGSQIIGGTVTGGGGLIGITGALILVETLSEGGFAAVFGIIIGVPITAVGVIVTSAGVLTLSIGKKFRNNTWEYKIVQMDNSQ